MLVLFIFGCVWVSPTIASEEDYLSWTSVIVQCRPTSKAGDISCEIKTGEKGYEKFVVCAFGKTNLLSTVELAKLSGFPLSSLQTAHEAGYEELGGYTVHFRFERTYYDAAKKLTTERLYVSVNKNGASVGEPREKRSR